jgi:hypothetical protein
VTGNDHLHHAEWHPSPIPKSNRYLHAVRPMPSRESYHAVVVALIELADTTPYSSLPVKTGCDRESSDSRSYTLHLLFKDPLHRFNTLCF